MEGVTSLDELPLRDDEERLGTLPLGPHGLSAPVGVLTQKGQECDELLAPQVAEDRGLTEHRQRVHARDRRPQASSASMTSSETS